MSRYYVFVKINGEQQRHLMRQYSVSGYPTIKFLRSDGSVIGQHVGYAPLQQMLNVMNKMRG